MSVLSAKTLGALRSRTMWVAIFISVCGAIQAQSNAILPLLGPHWAGIVLLVVGIIMGVLRTITTTAIEEKVPTAVSIARDHDGLDGAEQ